MAPSKKASSKVVVPAGSWDREYSGSELLRVEAGMYPGKDKASEGGFLAPGEKLLDVIQKDTIILEGIGVTHEELVEKFMGLVDTSWNRTHGYGTHNGDDFYVAYGPMGHKGFQHCPYCLDGAHVCRLDHRGWSRYYNNVGFQIISNKHRRTPRSWLRIDLPEQTPHLIHDHHFFEGSTRYRVDPNLLAQVFNMGSYKI